MALVNAVLVRYATSYVWVTDAASITAYGRREGFLSLGSATTEGEAQRIAEAILTQRSTPEVAVSAGMEPVGGVAPYVSFNVADHINVPDESGTPASMRVVAVTVTEDDEGNPIYVPELQTLNQELDQRLAQAIKAMGNGTLGGSVLSASPAPLTGAGVSSDPTGSWSGSGVSGPDGGAGSVGVVEDPQNATEGSEEFFRGSRIASYEKAPGTGTTTYGGAGAWFVQGTITDADDADGPWLNLQIIGSGEAGAHASPYNRIRRDWGIDFLAVVKPVDLTGVRIWCGMFSADPSASDDPAVHGAAFRYATASDGTAFWRTWTNDGSGGGTVTTTSVAITNGTAYHLRITADAGGTVTFYVDDTEVAAHTTNLPSATQAMGWMTALNNTSGTKNFKWSRTAWIVGV